MENKIVINGIEIEYSNELLDKIRQYHGSPKDSPVSQFEIASFLKQSMSYALDKGYAIVED